MKFSIYTTKRKVNFILTKEEGKYKVIKKESIPIIEKTDKGYKIKK